MTKICIKKLSTESVKASGNPEEHHLGELLTLSKSDIRTVPAHLPIVYIYPKIKDGISIELLKYSLEKALSLYYPFAGRLKYEQYKSGPRLVIHCNNAGVPFIEASSNVDLNEAISDYSQPAIFPHGLSSAPSPNLVPILSHPLLTVQATKFSCGGILLAVSFHHCCTDGAGFFSFMSAWAAISRGKQSIPLPYHNRAVFAHRWPEDDPELPIKRGQITYGNGPVLLEKEGTLRHSIQSCSKEGSEMREREALPHYSVFRWMKYFQGTVSSFIKVAVYLSDLMLQCTREPAMSCHCFHFSNEELKELKTKASKLESESKYTFGDIDVSDVAWVSTDDALAAHIWQVLTRARSRRSDRTITYRRAVDSRSKLNPPLPDTYFGNAVLGDHPDHFRTTVRELLSAPLPAVARFLRRSVNLVDEEYSRKFWALPPPVTPLSVVIPPIVGNGTLITSWAKFDMYGADFGDGKPASVCVSYGDKPRFMSGSVVIQRGSKPDGSLDVVVVLPFQVIERMKIDPEFRMHA